MTDKDMRITGQIEEPHQRELEKYCKRVEQMENLFAHVDDGIDRPWSGNDIDTYADLLELAAAWQKEGRRVALATVVAAWGSSPRPPGSQLLADDSGRFMGSVSGGCIEGEVVRRALEIIGTGEPALLDFGISNENAWSVGLSCGGRIQVFVEPVE